MGGIGKKKASHSMVNAIKGKCLRTPLRANKGRKYNSNATKGRGNRTKRLALWNRSPSGRP